MQESAIFLLGTEAHDVLDAGPVIPAAVEQHDLASGWQVADVSLEVPVGPLALRWRGQSSDPGYPRVEVLRHALDRAALSGRIPALEYHDEPGALSPDPL